nr:glycoside hydrolase family 125 protein [uncultured Agathobaculum sp.]
MGYSLENMQKDVHEIADVLSQKLPTQMLKGMFHKCFVNTIDTTVQETEDLPFVITGDIPAMWLRDSASQVTHYLPFLKRSEALRMLVRSIVQRQARYVINDAYANAFNECANGKKGDDGDITEDNPMAWERKYEVDSLCSMIDITDSYYRASEDKTVLDETIYKAFVKILDVWETEQHHMERSPYSFQRFDCPPTDTLPHEGKGNPVGYTGMTWSGFRPSDDACTYGYLIPANMYAVVVLRKMSRLFTEIWHDEMLAQRAERLAADIDDGIQKFGIVEHEKYGKIYAYEVDGLGNHVLMDDANVPSLLSIPVIGYASADDEIYQNTRKFVLSEDNPFYFVGTQITGVGSPHTKHGYVWPIALCIQALTSKDTCEIENLAQMLCTTTADTGYMHESIDANDQKNFSRPWFAWANSLFAHMIYEKYIK